MLPPTHSEEFFSGKLYHLLIYFNVAKKAKMFIQFKKGMYYP